MIEIEPESSLKIDLQDWEEALPDISWYLVGDIWRIVEGKLFELYKTVPIFWYRMITVVSHIFILNSVVRWLPAFFCVPLMWGLGIYSIINGMGTLLLIFLLFDFFKFLFRRTPPSFTESPAARYANGKNPWWSEGFNFTLFALIVLVVFGIYYGALESGMLSLLIGVLSVICLSNTFPTVGGHSTGNNIILFSVILMAIMISMGGLADCLDFVKQILTQTNREPPEPEIQSTMFRDFSRFTGPMFTWFEGSPVWGYSLFNVGSLLRFILGNAYLIFLVLSNLKGPVVAIATLVGVLYKTKGPEETAPKDGGELPVTNSRWLFAVIIALMQTFFTRHIVRLICLIPAAGIAYFIYTQDKKIWIGKGKLAACTKGRYDMNVSSGSSIVTNRVTLIKFLISFCILSNADYIPPIIIAAMVLAVLWFTDHRILCIAACMVTQEIGFFVGSVTKDSLGDKLRLLCQLMQALKWRTVIAVKA